MSFPQKRLSASTNINTEEHYQTKYPLLEGSSQLQGKHSRNDRYKRMWYLDKKANTMNMKFEESVYHLLLHFCQQQGQVKTRPRASHLSIRHSHNINVILLTLVIMRSALLPHFLQLFEPQPCLSEQTLSLIGQWENAFFAHEESDYRY